jgi:hypothetical protein
MNKRQENTAIPRETDSIMKVREGAVIVALRGRATKKS